MMITRERYRLVTLIMQLIKIVVQFNMNKESYFVDKNKPVGKFVINVTHCCDELNDDDSHNDDRDRGDDDDDDDDVDKLYDSYVM